ncbi:hypothetical protein Salmuc_02685 [Salipiger mucosus DSM 16094]|uniref:Uncharacterized protein n=1 Tax=Salipiger mucosus DSM 16094 TaxID=1123237 RepID=S9QV77_9RHOB|nr:hypothetical protein Salmuc_02685 [Salipiger mucosus DSM 16094]
MECLCQTNRRLKGKLYGRSESLTGPPGRCPFEMRKIRHFAPSYAY